MNHTPSGAAAPSSPLPTSTSAAAADATAAATSPTGKDVTTTRRAATGPETGGPPHTVTPTLAAAVVLMASALTQPQPQPPSQRAKGTNRRGPHLYIYFILTCLISQIPYLIITLPRALFASREEQGRSDGPGL